jgi:hypothetical protein
MKELGKHNPEYMAVLTEVVRCLIHQLHHPKLSMDAKQITDWFHHISEEQVGEVLHRMEGEDRHGTAKSQPTS